MKANTLLYDLYRLLQHYKLYQFVFSHTQAEEIIGLDLTCELVQPADVPYPPPLTEGLPGDVWEKYVKTPPPTPLPTQEVSLWLTCLLFTSRFCLTKEETTFFKQLVINCIQNVPMLTYISILCLEVRNP